MRERSMETVLDTAKEVQGRLKSGRPWIVSILLHVHEDNITIEVQAESYWEAVEKGRAMYPTAVFVGATQDRSKLE